MRVANLTAEFVGGELAGNISFTLPEKTVVGDFLNGNVEYTVSVNGKEHSKGAGTPGDHISLDITLSEGMANISVVTANADGVGQEAKTSVYVGNDNPEAPSDVVLTVADGIFTIRWRAPGQIGSHDGYVDAEAITYTVVRYPGEMIVAEGLAATEFSEKVPLSPLLTLKINVLANKYPNKYPKTNFFGYFSYIRVPIMKPEAPARLPALV